MGGGIILLVIIVKIFLVILFAEDEDRLRPAEKKEADRRQPEIKRAKQTALIAHLLKRPAAVAAVIATLIRLPIVRYKKHRLEIEGAKQVAAEREAERQRSEAERAKQAAAQREAEWQRWEAERAKQAALVAQQRKGQQYWESLGGVKFERELGKLFKARG